MPGLVSCAAILAGGASRRMGTNKSLLPLEDEPLIARIAGVLRPLFDQLIIVARQDEVSRAAALPAIADTFPNNGPLGGIRSALEYFQEPTFCVACDLPFLNAAVIRFLCERFTADCEVLAPRVSGRMETTHAIYTPSCVQVLDAEFQNERVRSAERVLAPLRVCFAEADELRQFDSGLKFLTNVNTPEEARRAGVSGIL